MTLYETAETLLSQGGTVAEVADATGISQRTIYKLRRQIGLPAKKRRQGTGVSRAREYHLARAYDLTHTQYEEMLVEQDGKCALCPKMPEENKWLLVVDHCHKTGRVRALLCTGCNTRLGRVEASPWHEKANRYLGKGGAGPDGKARGLS